MDICIPYGEKLISASFTIPRHSNGCGVILTHGAGGDKDFQQLVTLDNFLTRHGFTCLRFTCKGLNLSYRIKVYGSVFKYLLNQTQSPVSKCFVGGRSMGSRAAVGLVNSLTDTEFYEHILGVLCLSYPLHTKDDLSNLRDEPLKILDKPVLLISGTADGLCQKTLLDQTVKEMKCNVTVHWLKDCDHSLKSKGNSEEDSMTKICDFVLQCCVRFHVDGTIPASEPKTWCDQSRKRRMCNVKSKVKKPRK